VKEQSVTVRSRTQLGETEHWPLLCPFYRSVN
jgi:hypothetical protein